MNSSFNTLGKHSVHFTNQSLAATVRTNNVTNAPREGRSNFLYFTQRNRQNACMEEAQIEIKKEQGQTRHENVKLMKSFNKKFTLKTKYSDLKSFAAYKQEQARVKNSVLKKKRVLYENQSPCLGMYEIKTDLIMKKLSRNQKFYKSQTVHHSYLQAPSQVQRKQIKSAHQSRKRPNFSKERSKSKQNLKMTKTFDMSKQLPRRQSSTKKKKMLYSQTKNQSISRCVKSNPFMAPPLSLIDLNGTLSKYHMKYRISPCKNLKSNNYREIADRNSQYQGPFELTTPIQKTHVKYQKTNKVSLI